MKNILSLILLLTFSAQLSYAQQVKARSKTGAFEQPLRDETPPTIEILEPAELAKRGMKLPNQADFATASSSLVLRGLAKDSSGVARVLVNGEETQLNPSGDGAEFNSTIVLAIGDNEIVVKATDRFKNESTLKFLVRREGALISGKNFALLIATDEYDQWPRLINPVNDARTAAEELGKSYGYTTEIVENGAVDRIVSSLRRYAERKYNENDQLFIFIAGHGQFDEVLGDGYVVAKDSKLKDETKTSYISHSNLRTIVNNIPCRHIFLVVDACFGGTFDPLIAANQRGESEYAEATKSEFIQRKMKFKTRRFLTSGGKEYVPDGRPGQHSPFTRRFLEALRSYGGKDGVLTLNEIFSFVEKVKPEPRAGEFGTNEPGSDFIFVAR